MAKKAKIESDSALKPGWWVAVALKPGTAPLRSYVGQIEAIDARGMRLTLVDWLIGTASGWDLYIPHGNLESALVATEKHDVKAFGEAAGKWQTQMEEQGKQNPGGREPGGAEI
jgi:hypothetical protein